MALFKSYGDKTIFFAELARSAIDDRGSSLTFWKG